MEKSNLIVNGNNMKLPIGYRFHPTDEELVVHYLRRKVFGVPLPASVIPELDVFQTDPWNLPGDLKEKRYFFGRKWGNDNENYRCKRAAGSGYWKSTGKSRPIIASFSNHMVGLRKTFIFSQGKHSNDSKTQWIMHEYHLIGSTTILNTAQVSKIKLGDWVVYSLFQKKRRPKKQGKISQAKLSSSSEVMNPPSFMEFTMEERSPQTHSPCSSGITEVSSNELEQEEISSSISNFSFHSCKRKTT